MSSLNILLGKVFSDRCGKMFYIFNLKKKMQEERAEEFSDENRSRRWTEIYGATREVSMKNVTRSML